MNVYYYKGGLCIWFVLYVLDKPMKFESKKS